MSNLKYAHLCYGFPLLDEDGEPLATELSTEVRYGTKEGISFCSHDIDSETSVDIVGVHASEHQASTRDNPMEIESLEVKPEWREILKAFCEKHNLPFKEPKWVLAVSWDK